MGKQCPQISLSSFFGLVTVSCLLQFLAMGGSASYNLKRELLDGFSRSIV
jgi:hypothetical protein